MFAKSLSPAKGTLLDVPGFLNSSARLFSLVLALCSLLSWMGCSFPKIIILKDPLTPEEHLNLGVAYEKRGELDAAIKEYKLGAKKLPLGFLYLGNAYFQKQEFDQAQKYYRKAIKGEPGNADAHNNLAWLYYTKKENLDQAENLALKALELNPAKENVYQDTLEKIRQMKSDLANRGDRK
jgi:tetratricopeptide (TPR) repeat protein